MVKRLAFLLALFLSVNLSTAQENEKSFQFNFRSDLFRIHDFNAEIIPGEEANLKFTALDGAKNVDKRITGPYKFLINKSDTANVYFSEGIATYNLGDIQEFYFIQYLPEPEVNAKIAKAGESKLIYINASSDEPFQHEIPLWMSLLPPLLAIALALIFKEVIISLFAGIWIGSFLIYGFRPDQFFMSLFRVIDKYIIASLMDTGHLSVVLFSLMIGGMVAIISRNGGMAGIVDKLSRYANSAKNAQLVTWFLGLAIFFDDYANTLIVGNTMRPVTDRYRVSREKLAYIVDSTAAPVAAIAFVTTWIGAELGYIGTQTALLGIEESPYSIFMNSLEYAFYPIFTLVFMIMLILMRRDYGSMRKAELRARGGEVYDKATTKLGEASVDDSLRSLDPVAGIKYRWYNAFIPIFTVVAVTITGLIYTGSNGAEWEPGAGFLTRLSAIIGNADAYVSLLWASLMGIVVAVILSISTKTLSFRYAMETMMDGFKTMMPAIVILVMAWALAILTVELHTADFLTSILKGKLSPHFMGVITFILAAIISFSTGSSWSTMAILYPLALPFTWALCAEAGLSYEESMSIMYNVTAVVLGGSVFGDHCSPISDTTVLSSLASSCNHIDHVRTQLPYAITVGLVSILADGLFDFLSFPWWLSYLVGFGILYLIIRQFGKKIPESFQPA